MQDIKKIAHQLICHGISVSRAQISESPWEALEFDNLIDLTKKYKSKEKEILETESRLEKLFDWAIVRNTQSIDDYFDILNEFDHIEHECR